METILNILKATPDPEQKAEEAQAEMKIETPDDGKTSHRASFLFDNAKIMTLSLLSRHITTAIFRTTVRRCVNNGDNTIYLYLSSEKDGPEVSFYRGGFGGDVDADRVAQMENRIAWVKSAGLRPVFWLFADDSPTIHRASLDAKKKYITDAVFIFDSCAAEYVLALEADEYLRSQFSALAIHLKGATNKRIGSHQLPGKYDLAKHPAIDVHYHQYGWGKKPAAILTETIDVIHKLGKPVVAAEYNKFSDSTVAKDQGKAAADGGAIGTGNGCW